MNLLAQVSPEAQVKIAIVSLLKFSQSLDREETINLVSQTNPDEFNKPLEFLSVPGSSQSHHREMRRSASEQAPYNLPSEVPGYRSKSFDYGSLSPSSTSRQDEVKERRRAFLVMQASLSGEAEMQGGTVSDEMSKRTTSTKQTVYTEGSIEKMRYSWISGGPSPQHNSIVQCKPHLSMLIPMFAMFMTWIA